MKSNQAAKRSPNQQLKDLLKSAKKGKARLHVAKRTEYNGRSYQSKHEANYAAKLDVMRSAKADSDRVIDVKYQVPYVILINNMKICAYLADFVATFADGHMEVIDAKGVKTEVYRLKKKMVEAYYKIKIKEV